MSFPVIDPTSTAAWKKLSAHAEKMKQVHMRDLFKQNADRFSTYSIQHNDLLFDYSKNLIEEETMHLLFELADECRLKDAY